jgi:long-chain acyl-CoA synthetase
VPYPGAHAATTPDKPAVVMADSGETLTYAQLEERSTRLAAHLRGLGMRRGDVVALLTDNRPQASEVYWACQRAGLYVTAVNWHLTPGEATYIVDDCGATVLIASAALGDLARAVLAGAPGVGTPLAYAGAVEGFGDYEAALAAADPTPPADQPRGGDLLYSSGTTGRPKGIKPALPDRQVTEPGDMLTAVFSGLYGFGSDSVYLSPAPIYHAAPLRFVGIIQSVGGTVVMMESFDAEGALAAIERFLVTHSQWVPTMFVRMLKLPEEVRRHYDVSSLRCAVHAAAPCPVEVKRAMIVYFERDEMPFSYHHDPAATAAAQHPDHPNWSTVGDMGYLDEDRFLFLTDRQSFMIISGGVNIYPREVEDVLVLHPSVADVAVLGVPDAEMGEAVKAVVQLADGVTPSGGLAADLIRYTRDRLAHYKCPVSVDFVEQLPRTPTGKLRKHVLRRRYWPAVTR